jgi:hypothetical protein
MELEGAICEKDPQQIAFEKAAFDWVSGKIDYERLMEKYPTYLLRLEERIARFVKHTARTILGNLGSS